MITCSEFRELWLKKDGTRMVDPVKHVSRCGGCQAWVKSLEIEVFAEFDGDDNFVCPVCNVGHDRSPINGFDVFRCLKCGQTYRIDPDVLQEMEKARADPDDGFLDSGFLETDLGDTPVIVDESGG